MRQITAEKVLLNFDPEQNNLLPVLREISAAFGYISEKNAEKIAEYFKVPMAKIFETASFYDLINAQKRPILDIKVCSGGDCAVGGSFAIISEIENYFKIKAGDAFNPKVKLEIISCLGQCEEGPIMIMNDKVFTQVTASSVHEILREYA